MKPSTYNESLRIRESLTEVLTAVQHMPLEEIVHQLLSTFEISLVPQETFDGAVTIEEVMEILK